MLHQARQRPPNFPARMCLPSKIPSQPPRCQSRTRPITCAWGGHLESRISMHKSCPKGAVGYELFGPESLLLRLVLPDTRLQHCVSGSSRCRTWPSGEASGQLVAWGGVRTQAEEVDGRACRAGLLQKGPATRPARAFFQKRGLKEEILLRNDVHGALDALAYVCSVSFCLPLTRSRQKRMVRYLSTLAFRVDLSEPRIWKRQS